ncbi:twin-arginine translocase TatA/TatE family subunit [Marinifilum fragile]|uniref:twin-arginine translocase TatA/TatE family subunit n=1 Tax=Marinifilum fragile TaxID=570161 RepID=UPI002AA6EBB9|nr:twin-arginine translocase TatA/TatE family subunit [Marinifilum fragile]
MNLFVIAGIPGVWQVVLVIFAILLLFGGKKIPELMKGLGQGMKEFKKATDQDQDKDNNKDKESLEK